MKIYKLTKKSFIILATSLFFCINSQASSHLNNDQLSESSLGKRSFEYTNSDKEESALQDFKKYRRSYDDQIHILTTKSEHVRGRDCARIGWIKDLNAMYTSKNPSKRVSVPADIHLKLKYLGDIFKGCSVYKDSCIQNPYRHQKNILVPYISYVVQNKRNQREFLRGDFLRNPKTKANRPIIFLSSSDDWGLQEKYDLYKDRLGISGEILPSMQVLGGSYTQKLVNKDFKAINEELRKKEEPKLYNWHTEEWFHEMINAYPNMVLKALENHEQNINKVYALVIDMYSIWDVCENCQKNFRQEFFEKVIRHKIENLIKEKHIKLPHNGLKIVYRVSSQQAYGRDPISNASIQKSEIGQTNNMLDIKAADTAQITVSTRVSSQKPWGWVTESKKVKTYINYKFGY